MKPEPINNILISHHLDDEVDNCVVVPFHGKWYHACVRCSSAVAATLITLPLHLFFPLWYPPFLLLAAFPDWILRRFRIWPGNNYVRCFSGLLLGTSYALNISELLLLRFRSSVWAVNLLAVTLYCLTLWLTWKTPKAAKLTDNHE
jgi:hypothetical protein